MKYARLLMLPPQDSILDSPKEESDSVASLTSSVNAIDSGIIQFN